MIRSSSSARRRRRAFPGTCSWAGRRRPGRTVQPRDANAGAARQVETLGELAREDLYRHWHPRLPRFEAGIFEPWPAEIDDRQQALAGPIEGDERGDTHILAASHPVDDGFERIEGRGRPVIDRQDHVVFAKGRLGLVGRTARADATDAHAIATGSLELLD